MAVEYPPVEPPFGYTGTPTVLPPMPTPGTAAYAYWYFLTYGTNPPGQPLPGSPIGQNGNEHVPVPVIGGANTGPTTPPAAPAKDHPDVYVPPYNEKAPPASQTQLRYDPVTRTYVAIKQWTAKHGWRTFDATEFRKFNEGARKVEPQLSDTEVSISGTVYIVRKHTYGPLQVIGVKVNGTAVYLPNLEAVERANGQTDDKRLPPMPPASDKPENTIVAPPVPNNGLVPPVQYVMRLDEASGIYLIVGEKHTDPATGEATEHTYTEAEYAAANAEVDNDYYANIPSQDGQHPDYRTFDVRTEKQRWLYRWIDGRYQIAGTELPGGKRVFFTESAREKINAGHVPPKPPAEKRLDDLPVENGHAHADTTVPPAGQPNTHSLIYRYDPDSDAWYLVGERHTDAQGEVTTQMYTQEQFAEANTRSNTKNTNKPQDGDYVVLGTNLVARKDAKTGKVTIVGIEAGARRFYFHQDVVNRINVEGNVQGPMEPKEPMTPQAEPPPTGEGASDGHPDFVSRNPDMMDSPRGYLIWRWEKKLNRYVVVGEYHDGVKRPDNEAKKHMKVFHLHMYTPEEYRKKNQGADRFLPPAEKTDFKYPEFDPKEPEDIRKSETVTLYMPPGPANHEGESTQGAFVTGYPVYRKTKSGDWVIVGIQIYGEGKSERRWFTQEEYAYYNPGGKATENEFALHGKTSKGSVYNQPTLPWNDSDPNVPPLPTAVASRGTSP